MTTKQKANKALVILVDNAKAWDGHFAGFEDIQKDHIKQRREAARTLRKAIKKAYG